MQVWLFVMKQFSRFLPKIATKAWQMIRNCEPFSIIAIKAIESRKHWLTTLKIPFLLGLWPL